MLGNNPVLEFFAIYPYTYSAYSISLLLFFFYFLQPITLSLLVDSFDEQTKQNMHHSDLAY